MQCQPFTLSLALRLRGQHFNLSASSLPEKSEHEIAASMTAVDGLVSPTVALDTRRHQHLQREGTAHLPARDPTLSHIDSPNGRLITSPYIEPDQVLDLRTLDKPCQLLSRALTKLQPTRDDYATASYLDSFNWQTVFDSLRQLSVEEGHSWTRRSFYVIVFRSRLHPDIDSDRLYELDSQSHREAVASGGLLKYWFGTKNANRENLATCIWRSRQDARLGGTGPWHKRARQAIDEFYERITLTVLKLEIGDGVSSWGISEWRDEES